jgi:hypothetical protein
MNSSVGNFCLPVKHPACSALAFKTDTCHWDMLPCEPDGQNGLQSHTLRHPQDELRESPFEDR